MKYLGEINILNTIDEVSTPKFDNTSETCRHIFIYYPRFENEESMKNF